MRTPNPPQRHLEIGMHELEPASDIQMLVHSAWLLAGIAIALAACSVADESQLHQVAPDTNTSVAHLEPQANASTGNVQDMTY